jgi:hypothetical protein
LIGKNVIFADVGVIVRRVKNAEGIHTASIKILTRRRKDKKESLNCFSVFIHPSSLSLHPFKMVVRLTLGKMSAANLAAGKAVGNAERIGKRRIRLTGQAKCAGK